MKVIHIISSMNPTAGGVCQAVRTIIYSINTHKSLIINENTTGNTLPQSWGGAAQGIRNSISAMQNSGVENEVVCFDQPDSEFLKQDNFLVHALGKANNAWSYNPRFYTWLLENIGNYDTVIIHGLWLYHGYATYKAWKKYKKTHNTFPKLFVMPHGMLDPYFQQAKERRLKAIRNYFYWKIIEKKIINSADGVLFTCEEEMRLAREPFKPYCPKSEHNVTYGIQSPPAYTEQMTAAFAQKVSQWNSKPFILFLSRIHEKKGVDLLIRAYLNLTGFKNLLGLEQPQLIIAGPLESDYAREMQNLANSSLEGRSGGAIIFAGMLNGDAKWGAFYNCECFILPSHQENFGIAIVEAMACKKPVLITDKVNIWREIAEGNGGLVGNDTEEDTYNLLKKYLSLPPIEKEKMQENAFSTYIKYFSIEKSAEKMIGVLKNS